MTISVRLRCWFFTKAEWNTVNKKAKYLPPAWAAFQAALQLLQRLSLPSHPHHARDPLPTISFFPPPCLSPSPSCHSLLTTKDCCWLEGYKESAHTHSHTANGHSLWSHARTHIHTHICTQQTACKQSCSPFCSIHPSTSLISHTCLYTLNTHKHIHILPLYTFMHTHMHNGLPTPLVSELFRSYLSLFLAL